MVVWVAEGATGLPIDALVIAAIVVLNGILGLVQESKAETAVAALQSMTAASSTVLRDGALRTVPSSELVGATSWRSAKATPWVPTPGCSPRPRCALLRHR